MNRTPAADPRTVRRADRASSDTVASTSGAKRAPASRAGGFSLLEVLVAFVILSLVATALFRLFGGALNNASAADDYSRAALLAESVLAETAAGPLRESVVQGDAEEGRMRWTARVSAYTPPGVNPDLERQSEPMQTRLWRVAVEVAFPGAAGGERTYALATTRIGARNPQ
jgi:general secretion pathway protein I